MSPLPFDMPLPTLVRHRSAPACRVVNSFHHVSAAEKIDIVMNFAGLLTVDVSKPDPIGESASSIVESTRAYIQALALRAHAHACHRHAERKRLEAINKIQRFGLRVISKARRLKRTRSATIVQRHTRGMLQRIQISNAGAAHLSTRQARNQEVTDADLERFLHEKKNSPESRVALAVLGRTDSHNQCCWRPGALKTLANLEYERDNLIGMKATKDFLRNFRSNMISRIAFKEEICFPPLFLVGNRGCGKRLTAQLIRKELAALELCGGDLEEVRSYDDLKTTWKGGSDKKISKVIYISDVYDHGSRDWNVTMKRTRWALPKAALIFGFEDLAVTQRVLGCIITEEPERLVMPPLTAQELAELTVQKLKARGYTFAGGLSTDVVLEVVKDQWTTGEIESRNGHLANIMMNRVIKNKNDRVPLQYGKIVNPAVLTPADFGVTESAKMKLESQKLELIKELDSLPGFGDAKKFLHDVRRRTEYVQAGGNPCVLGSCMNLVLTGNPGTGKTTFARLLFRILRSYGVLKRDAFVEMNALELKGKYVGWTTPQVVAAFRSARGGALFLDEAYALCAGEGGKSDSFSSEAVHTLLTEIENNRSEVLVIIAGYKDKINHLLAQDPGLARRFPLKLDLPDYSTAELALIAKKVARDRFNFEFEDGLVGKLERYIEEEHRSDIRKHNAALAVTLVERAVERMTCRLVDAGVNVSASIGTLMAADFEIASTTVAEKAQKEAKAKIEEDLKNLVGMESPKMYLNQLRRKIEFVRLGGCPKVLDTCMNLVLTGNPGTGKTTFARLLFRFLLAHGVLKKDIFVERNVLELKGQYCGQTAPKIKAIFEMAVGGCLFLDEAYALTDGDKFSNEAVRMLLTEVENRRTEVLVILAGYEDRMAEFIKADPGLARRFPKTINLPDYGSEDIARIARGYAAKSMGVPFEAGLEQSLGEWLKPRMSGLQASKFNGGLAVNLTEQAIARLADRAVAANPASSGPALLQLSTADFGFGLNVMD